MINRNNSLTTKHPEWKTWPDALNKIPKYEEIIQNNKQTNSQTSIIVFLFVFYFSTTLNGCMMAWNTLILPDMYLVT